jgi:predicted HTH domain antitoxin
MAVKIQIPAEVELRLRAEDPDLEATAREAMLLELYRQDKLSHHELSQAMGLDRFETEGLLKRHGVTEDLPTAHELEKDLQMARSLLSQ